MFELFFETFFKTLGNLFNPFTIFIIAMIIVVLIIIDINYKKTSYYKITKTSLFSLISDLGKYGEYLIYLKLRKFEKNLNAKFLFNVYVPKENGETSEIDVIMITYKGIFVFESKNYSGWIFGNETQYNWTQVLPKGKGKSSKKRFYNPIMQNQNHIKHLQTLIGDDIPMHSIITFSERCTLKEITITSTDVNVINRYSVKPVVSTIYNQCKTSLNVEKIEYIFNLLHPFTQIDEHTKQQHIENIKENKTPKIITNTTPNSNDNIVKTDTEEITTDDSTNTINKNVLICPKCNGELVIRTAKHGKNKGKSFYGCSNYPKCKYINENVNFKN